METTGSAEQNLTVGHEVLDTEHGVQLQLLEALRKAMETSSPEVHEILERLLVFSDMHFGSEELLMRLHSYPRYASHVEEHRRLLEGLREIETRITDGGEPKELVLELRLWLTGHIAGMDRDFATAVRIAFGSDSP